MDNYLEESKEHVFTQPLHHEEDVWQGQFLKGQSWLEFSFPSPGPVT